MSGLHRLSGDALRRSSPSLRSPAPNFGLIAIVLLAMLAMGVTVMFPDAIPPAMEYPGTGSTSG